jgi:hypothetical protein
MGRRFVRRAQAAPSATDRIAGIASSAGEPVQDVLREVAEFRLALETDLLIAAAAVDADATDVAAEIVDAERGELAAFERRVLDRIASSPPVRKPAPVAPRSTRVRLAALAAAVVGLLGGTVATQVEQAPQTEQVALDEAEEQLDALARVALVGTETEVAAAAQELHAALEVLITRHAEGDASVSIEIAKILSQEQALLERQPGNGRAVMAQVTALAKRLTKVAPRSVRATIAPLVPIDPPSSRPSSKPSPKPSAKPTPKPSPKPSPSSSPSPKPSSKPSDKPSGSPSSSSGGVPTVAP